MRDEWRTRVEPLCSATILVGAAAFWFSFAITPVFWVLPYAFMVLAPAILFWATWQMWRYEDSSKVARTTTLALSLWAATAIVLMLIAVPISGKGPAGSGLRPEGSLDLFSLGTTILAPLYGVLMLASTALFWSRWSNRFRAVALVGALLTLPYFMNFVDRLSELMFAEGWRNLIGVALLPGTVLLIVAHGRLWLESGGAETKVETVAAETA